jgi:RsiW-degrading membrane proteinase PrsW (M82 family)
LHLNELIPSWLMAPGGHLALRVALALAPVLIFLAALVWLDSFRLVRKSRVLLALLAGAAGALLSYVVNSVILELTGLPTVTFAIVAAPLVEETFKGLWVAWQIRQRQVGFLVDAAILGFATGAGFAIVENIYYLQNLGEVPLLVWAIRGLGTALMHGGTTAILAVYLRGRSERRQSGPPWVAAIFLAALLHAAFNRFMTQPLLATLVMVVVLPILMTLVYRQGEHRLRDWLGRGFDRDRELLALINEGEVHTTPLGKYLVSLREHFRPDTVTDMLCLLRLQVELSIRAKGVLMLREQGLEPAPDPHLAGKLDELRWLETSIGPTGKLAMRPICHWRGADRWQRHLLEETD